MFKHGDQVEVQSWWADGAPRWIPAIVLKREPSSHYPQWHVRLLTDELPAQLTHPVTVWLERDMREA